MIPGCMANVGTEGELGGAPAESLLRAGVAALDRGDAAAALALFERVKAVSAPDADLEHAIATALRMVGRTEQAAAALDAALALDAVHVPSLYDRAQVLQQRGQLEAAAGAYARLNAHAPGHFRGLLNHGAVLYRLDDLPAAEACFHRAAGVDPASPLPLINLAMIARNRGQLDAAVAQLEQAIARAPDNAEAHWNLANILLLSGDFVAGFAAYEWRFRRAGREERPRSIPRWSGEPLAGETILLTAEQGAGDLIQFVRFAPELQRRGAHVVVECHPGLETLIATAPGVARTVALGAAVPEAEIYLPLLSVPFLLGVTLATLPPLTPYLSVPAGTPVPNLEGAFRVGLVWRGNPAHENDRWRSVALPVLAPVLATPGTTFFSLQVGEGGGEVHDVPAPIHDLAPKLTDFAATAAAIAALDLVITVDTAVAHLAGALGKPVWVLIAEGNDWRWGREGSASPWYPTLRLFRQRPGRDWRPALAEMAQALEETV